MKPRSTLKGRHLRGWGFPAAAKEWPRSRSFFFPGSRRPIRLYDTLSRSLVELPAAPDPLGIYVCGVTPYDSPHLGHARSAVVYDALVRLLGHLGRRVTFVRNITDIDDKIIDRSADRDYREIVDRYTAEYHDLVAALKCRSPDVEPRVTDNIPEIIAFIEGLVAGEKAYGSSGSVYFAVRSAREYGRLSNRTLDQLRDDPPADREKEKRDPLDFALWKAAKPGEPAWESPWGRGRPGWHIECSVMSMKYLGENFDIHGGGNDLLFPHHENERAQSYARSGKELARVWMHNGLITRNRAKMSKSTGNVAEARELIKRHGADAVRYYLLSVHYGSPLEYGLDRVEEAARSLEKFRAFGASTPDENRAADRAREIEERFQSALSDDFNTARAFAVLFESIRDFERMTAPDRSAVRGGVARSSEILGIHLFPSEEITEEIRGILGQREAARLRKDFTESDRLRKILSGMGIIVEDTAAGQRWRR